MELIRSENVSIHPWQATEASLKDVTELHVWLSVLGIPAGDLQGIALSIWYIVGIQLSNLKLDDEQSNFEESDV